ncbi:hypothetical protein ASE27_10940 [Oerskovia sp. Root918]|uniref:hypothetical protein n=1 Tax=unclassified Oerskovia TaxID=2619021 RepID=UPI0006F86B16|nr:MULTISPECIES: hypothetical protein [unclassified Oerskovia]KRC39074.1 hypothetical protein ASE15_19955 [Oerskovia sp. Root22]KRD36145.1 hypothetical protein ASE27_10940 [Oerskovia sp. Root918]
MTELTLHDAAKRQVVRSNLTLTAILVPLLGLNALTTMITTRNVWLALGYLCLVLAMVPLVYFLARRMADRSRVTFGDGSVTMQGWGRPKRFTVADVERVVTIDQMGFMGTAPTHHLVVVGPRKRLLLLVGQMWDREQLSALALDLAHRGVPLTPIHQPVTPAQLRTLDPRLVPWRQAHPVALSLLVVLGVLLVLVAVFVVVVTILV